MNSLKPSIILVGGFYQGSELYTLICGGSSVKRINKISLISLFILIISFIIIRYALFEMHRMKQVPFMLFLPILLSITILCFKKAKIMPFALALSYPIGFVLGVMFQTYGVDAGGGTANNMWIIWTIVIIVIIIFSIVIELINKKKGRS